MAVPRVPAAAAALLPSEAVVVVPRSGAQRPIGAAKSRRDRSQTCVEARPKAKEGARGVVGPLAKVVQPPAIRAARLIEGARQIRNIEERAIPEL